MSGPIVRKYGFPNFDKIFGERELQHGVDENETTAPEQAGSGSDESSAAAVEKKAKAPARKSKKKS